MSEPAAFTKNPVTRHHATPATARRQASGRPTAVRPTSATARTVAARCPEPRIPAQPSRGVDVGCAAVVLERHLRHPVPPPARDVGGVEAAPHVRLGRGVDPFPVLGRLDQCGLEQVLGVLVVAGQQVRHPQQGAAAGAHEGGEPRLVRCQHCFLRLVRPPPRRPSERMTPAGRRSGGTWSRQTSGDGEGRVARGQPALQQSYVSARVDPVARCP